MSELVWEEIKQSRKSKHVFGTNFGYEGRDLQLAISMYELGFDNGFEDLKLHIENLEDEIRTLKENHNA